jgi:hypothetical protein
MHRARGPGRLSRRDAVSCGRRQAHGPRRYQSGPTWRSRSATRSKSVLV